MGTLVTDYFASSEGDLERHHIEGNVYFGAHENKSEIEVLLTWHQRVDETLLNEYPNIKFIQRYGVGVDTIDLNLCKARNIVVCNNPYYGIEEVASSALGMALYFARGLGNSQSNCLSLCDKPDGRWQELRPAFAARLTELTLGIVGYGRIGSRLAMLAKQIFGRIVFFDPYLPSGVEKIIGVSRVTSLEQLIDESNVISLHCPLTDETQGLLSPKMFVDQIDQKILVNTARGALLTELSEWLPLLADGVIAGMGLDVMPDEPPLDPSYFGKVMKKAQSKGNLLINNHSAFYSPEALVEMRTLACRNINLFNNSKTVFNRVV